MNRNDIRALQEVDTSGNILLETLVKLAMEGATEIPSAIASRGRVTGNTAPSLQISPFRFVEKLRAFVDRDAVHNQTNLEQTTPSAGAAIAHTFVPAVPPGTPGYVLCPILACEFELSAAQVISRSPVDLRITGTDWQGNAFVQQCVVTPEVEAGGAWNTKVLFIPGFTVNSRYNFQPMRYNPLIIAGVYAATGAVMDCGIAGGNIAPAGVACTTRLIVSGSNYVQGTLEFMEKKTVLRNKLIDIATGR